MQGAPALRASRRDRRHASDIAPLLGLLVMYYHRPAVTVEHCGLGLPRPLPCQLNLALTERVASLTRAGARPLERDAMLQCLSALVLGDAFVDEEGVLCQARWGGGGEGGRVARAARTPWRVT